MKRDREHLALVTLLAGSLVIAPGTLLAQASVLAQPLTATSSASDAEGHNLSMEHVAVGSPAQKLLMHNQGQVRTPGNIEYVSADGSILHSEQMPINVMMGANGGKATPGPGTWELFLGGLALTTIGSMGIRTTRRRRFAVSRGSAAVGPESDTPLRGCLTFARRLKNCASNRAVRGMGSFGCSHRIAAPPPLRSKSLLRVCGVAPFLMIAMSPSGSMAGPLLYYDVATATSSSLPLAPTYVGGSGSDLTASQLIESGLAPTWACCQNSTGELSFTGWGDGRPGNGFNPGPDGAYLQLSLTASSGPIQLSEMDYSWFSDLNSDLYNGPDELSVYVSFDNFATSTLIATHYTPPGYPYYGDVNNYSDDLSSLTVAPGQTISIRFVGWSDARFWDSGAGFWDSGPGNENLTISGTVSGAPEPAAWSLILAGAAALALFRYRNALAVTYVPVMLGGVAARGAAFRRRCRTTSADRVGINQGIPPTIGFAYTSGGSVGGNSTTATWTLPAGSTSIAFSSHLRPLNLDARTRGRSIMWWPRATVPSHRDSELAHTPSV